MDRVLLVDDDKLTRIVLREGLEQQDFFVMEAASGKRLNEVLREHPVDIVLLDLHLPDGKGVDFIPDIRKWTNAPIIIVSGDDETDAKVNGFECGADDYVSKPFDIDELVARVNTNIERYRKFQEYESKQEEHSCVHFDGWEFDRVRFQIFNREKEPGTLTAREFELLGFLIERAGEPIKRDELCEMVKQDNYVPTARSIDIKIARIRKKLGDDTQDPQLIKTIRGVGYMFNREKISQTQ